mmetsp:Transcript_159811/g.297930  ORF Transcript_159811/g.297930 Transcript_159811/m.297930 type:complete len:254 (+) Transcript_159811:3-764(+)
MLKSLRPEDMMSKLQGELGNAMSKLEGELGKLMSKVRGDPKLLAMVVGGAAAGGALTAILAMWLKPKRSKALDLDALKSQLELKFQESEKVQGVRREMWEAQFGEHLESVRKDILCLQSEVRKEMGELREEIPSLRKEMGELRSEMVNHPVRRDLAEIKALDVTPTMNAANEDVSDVASVTGCSDVGSDGGLSGMTSEEKADLKKMKSVVGAAGAVFSKQLKEVKQQMLEMSKELSKIRGAVKQHEISGVVGA